MLTELVTSPAAVGVRCPFCSGRVRRLPHAFIEGDPQVTATSVHLEHSEPVCNAFGGHARSLRSRDESLIHVPAELECLPLPLRALVLQVLR